MNVVEAALLAGLRSDRLRDRPVLAALTSLQWGEVAALASQQRIAALFLYRLTNGGHLDIVDAAARQALEARARAAAFQSIAFRAELIKLASAVSGQGLHIVALKGIHLDAAVYDKPGLREMNDLDLLTTEAAVHPVAAAARTLGYVGEPEFDDTLSLTPELHHLPHMAKPGIGLEIHWRLLPVNTLSADVTDQLLARARPLRSHPNTYALAPEDLLLHVAIHGALQHCFEQGVRPLCDTHAIVQRHHDTLRWDEVVDRAIGWGCARAALLVLRLANDYLDTPVPPFVLARLGNDRLTSDVVSQSMTLALTPGGARVNLHSGRLLGDRPAASKLATLWPRVWPSREYLAWIYPPAATAGTLTVLYYRARRVADLLWRYTGPLLTAATISSSSEHTFVHGRNRVQDWLREA